MKTKYFYDLIAEHTAEALSWAVNQKLDHPAETWVIHGNPTCINEKYCQAMVRVSNTTDGKLKV
jgi:hypothetical protein